MHRKSVPHLHLARLMTHLVEHSVIRGPGDQKGPSDIGVLFQNPQSRYVKEDALRIPGECLTYRVYRGVR